MQKILCALFIASTIVYAGGAASLVGKKSSSKGYSYTPATEFKFIADCKEDANEQVCRCVLEKIKGQYSEKEYKKIDKDLRNNIPQPEFVDFVSKASQSCDKNDTPSTFDEHIPHTERVYIPDTVSEESPLTEDEVRENIQYFLKTTSKKEFIESCPQKTKMVLGDKTARKVYGCIYDFFANNQEHLVKKFAGKPAEANATLNSEIFSNCLPQKFTSDFKNDFISYFNQNGVPISISRCIIDKFEKNFTFKNFFLGMANNSEAFTTIFDIYHAECQIGK